MAVPVRLFAVLIALAVVLAAGNIGQYLYFTGRIRADSARYSERERELEERHGDLERELAGERSRQQEALGIVGGIEESLGRTGTSVREAIEIVRRLREELKTLEARLNR